MEDERDTPALLHAGRQKKWREIKCNICFVEALVLCRNRKFVTTVLCVMSYYNIVCRLTSAPEQHHYIFLHQ